MTEGVIPVSAPSAEENEVQKVDEADHNNQNRAELASLTVLPDGLVGLNSEGVLVDAKQSAGLAVIEQRQAIPTTGKRLVTSKWEYWTFVIMYFNSNGSREACLRLLKQTS